MIELASAFFYRDPWNHSHCHHSPVHPFVHPTPTPSFNTQSLFVKSLLAPPCSHMKTEAHRNGFQGPGLSFLALQTSSSAFKSTDSTHTSVLNLKIIIAVISSSMFFWNAYYSVDIFFRGRGSETGSPYIALTNLEFAM